jgi:hypothetical protein
VKKAIKKGLALRLEAPEQVTFCPVLSSRETILREDTSLGEAADCKKKVGRDGS